MNHTHTEKSGQPSQRRRLVLVITNRMNSERFNPSFVSASDDSDQPVRIHMQTRACIQRMCIKVHFSDDQSLGTIECHYRSAEIYFQITAQVMEN